MNARLEMSEYQIPSFSIFKPNSTEKVETLKHCFIKRMVLKTCDLPAVFKAEDGHVYTAAYDSRLPLAAEVEVIISFQAHTYGKFAVVRAARNNKEQ